MQEILQLFQYYWVTTQSEYSTDILFKRRQDLRELYARLLSHSTLRFGAKEVMNFREHDFARVCAKIAA